METRKLAYFVKIVDAGSITRAAAALHVAQPALSQQVASLGTPERRGMAQPFHPAGWMDRLVGEHWRVVV